MIKFVKYWWWRKYKEIPHPEEIAEIRAKVMSDKNKLDTFGRPYNYLLNKKWSITKWYTEDKVTVEQIATEYNVTRTRIRMIIWRFYYDYKRGKL